MRTRQECLKVNLVLGKGAPALEVKVKHHFPPRRAAAPTAARAAAERPASLRIRRCLRAVSRLLTRPLLPLLACLRVRRILLVCARRAARSRSTCRRACAEYKAGVAGQRNPSWLVLAAGRSLGHSLRQVSMSQAFRRATWPKPVCHIVSAI